MSTQKRQIEILEFLGEYKEVTQVEINTGLEWINQTLTNRLIQGLKDQNLVFHDINPNPSLRKFSLTLQGYKTLQQFGG